MKIALDPTPFHHDYELREFPQLVADLGYEYLQLTPHRDFIPFFNHPRADDTLVARFRKACASAGVGIASDAAVASATRSPTVTGIPD